MNRSAIGVGLVLSALVVSLPAGAATIYATVPEPVQISWASNGDLYVGRDKVFSGGGTATPAPIHKVTNGGATVMEFGPAISDPDSVLFDELGNVTAANSILVGGADAGLGVITAVASDQSASVLVSSGNNIGGMVFDGSGRLIYTDGTTDLKVFSGGVLSTLVTLPGVGQRMTYDPIRDLLYVQVGSTTIATYATDGTLVDPNFASNILWQFDTGPGDVVWGDSLYAVNSSGRLVQIDADTKSVTQLDEQLPRADGVRFGPDGALYISVGDFGQVLRVAEPEVLPEPSVAILLGTAMVFALWRRRS